MPHEGARRCGSLAFEIFGSCLAPPTAPLQIANPTCASSPFSSLLLRPRSCPVTGRGRSHSRSSLSLRFLPATRLDSRRTQATRSTRKRWFLLPARPRSRSPSPSRPWRPPRRRPTGPSRRSPAPRSRARAADRAGRRSQVTFGAQDPVFFELPAKRSPKGTPLFGGNKDPKTLFEPPKPTPEFQKPLRFGERLERNKKAPPTA